MTHRNIINEILASFRIAGAPHSFSKEAAASCMQEAAYYFVVPEIGYYERIYGDLTAVAYRWASAYLGQPTQVQKIVHVFPSGDVYEIART